MSVIKGVVMLTVLVIGGEGVARGTKTLTEQRGILIKGLAEAIVSKFAASGFSGELRSLITEQKREYLLSMSEKFFAQQLEEHMHRLQRDESIFTPLLENGKLLTDDDDVQQAWEEITAELHKVEEMAKMADTEARRQKIADYLAAEATQSTIDAFDAYFPPINGHADDAPKHFSNAIQEAYLNLLHYKELENLAHALGQGKLVLAAENPLDRRIREHKTKEEISKLSKVLTGSAAQKQAAEQGDN